MIAQTWEFAWQAFISAGEAAVLTINIKDVAKAAGVSIASVSRTISGAPGVSAETANRIRQMMSQMGYRPNLGARGLVKGRTSNIAVAFPRGSSFVLGNPFFSRVLEGIAKVLDQGSANGIPVEKGEIISLSLNTAAAERMGVTIPQELVTKAVTVYKE